MPAVGMDISETSLRFVQLMPQGDGFVLKKYGERAIPAGVIADGDIKQADIFRDVLRRVKKDFGIRFVRASLSETHSYIAEIEIPRVPLGELRESLELQIGEHVPLPPEDIFFDYTIVDADADTNTNEAGGKKDRERAKRNSPNLRLIISAVSKAPVLKYVDVFSSAGLTLLSLEVDANALVRAILSPGERETALVIEVGRVKTGFYVVTNRSIRFVSEVDIGANSLGPPNTPVDVPIESTASALAGEPDGAAGGENMENSARKFSRSPEKISAFFSQIKEESEKHYIYWNSRHDRDPAHSEKIERIILAGSQSGLAGLAEYLSAVFREPVSRANPWTNVASFRKYIPEIPREESLRYTTAIGLALHPYEKFLS